MCTSALTVEVKLIELLCAPQSLYFTLPLLTFRFWNILSITSKSYKLNDSNKIRCHLVIYSHVPSGITTETTSHKSWWHFWVSMAKVEVRRALHRNFIQQVIIPRVSDNAEKEYSGRYKMQLESGCYSCIVWVVFSFYCRVTTKRQKCACINKKGKEASPSEINKQNTIPCSQNFFPLWFLFCRIQNVTLFIPWLHITSKSYTINLEMSLN